MHITHLNLTNFRNYAHLELDIPSRHIVIQGDNAQGKTNLLEAIHILATTKSFRANNEREIINWAALKTETPIARIFANVQREKNEVKVEIALRCNHIGSIQKRIRVNDIPRHASEAVGQVNVVLFEAQDIALIDGSPSLRRRYLDLINSQIDHRYLHSLQQYNRVLSQRNSLLRLIREHKAQCDQLEFWDNELSNHGSYLMLQRQQMITNLNKPAREIHQKLSKNGEELGIAYLPSLEHGKRATGQLQAEALMNKLREVLQQSREREIAAGLTLVGPHRDTLKFLVNGIDIGVYGSRGQQRTVIVALKLAEAKYMQEETGEYPIILLDDVLSELDTEHQQQLLQLVLSLQQVIITTTNPSIIDDSFLSQSTQFKIKQGVIEQL